MLKKQFIAILFASLLLAYLGHNIVPHHHHHDNIHPCQDCHHHETCTYAIQTGDPAAHCHAFNGMEYFPTTEKTDLNKSLKSITGPSLSLVLDPGQYHFQNVLREPGGPPPLLERFTYSAFGLRGPPCLS